jgi:phage tail-like protein
MGYEGHPDQGLDVLSTTNAVTEGLKTPIRGFRFTADFGARLGTTSFKSITGGFTTEVETVEYREGGFGTLTKRKLPGLVTYNNFSIEKGLYINPTLYTFFNQYLEGETFEPVPESIITVFNNAMQPQARWIIINAWPMGYESGDLSADDSGIIFEKITLAHEGIRRDLTVS